MEKEFLETFFTPTQQSLFFLYSVILGAVLSVVFDCFRVIRTVFPHTGFMVAIEDIIFCIIWGLAVFVFSVELSRGEVRGYYFLGNLLGFLICHYTAGNVFVNAVRKIAWFVKKVLRKIYQIILLPVIKVITLICQKVIGIFVGIYRKLKINANKRKMLLKDNKKMLYNNSTHKIKNKVVKKDVRGLGQKSKKRKEKTPFQ